MRHPTDAGGYRGRPVLFLIGVLSLWVTGRASVMMWNDGAAAQDVAAKGATWEGVKLVPLAWVADRAAPIKLEPQGMGAYGLPARPSPAHKPAMVAKAKSSLLLLPVSMKDAEKSEAAPLPFLHLQGFSLAEVRATPPVFVPARSFARTSPQSELPTSRWSASAWALWRPGERAGESDTALPLYGGSQVGARIAYRVDRAKAVDLYVRASAPLVARGGKEVALGASVKPIARINAAVAVEQRIRVDGAGKRHAPALLGYGGFGPRAIGRLEAEGYAQAGVVGIKDAIPFADGALTLTKPLGNIGSIPLRFGGGVWGGAQKGASRIDIGPRFSADIPLSKRHRVRAALDWRQRIGGAARPGSGLALSLGTDF